jgi:PIN domain nuclease of toxin-antitoxin system
MKTNGLLLDTCAVIWLSHGQPVARQAIDRIKEARQADELIGVFIMSAWELGVLVSKGRLPSVREPRRWFDEFVKVGKATIADVTSRILVDESFYRCRFTMIRRTESSLQPLGNVTWQSSRETAQFLHTPTSAMSRLSPADDTETRNS